MLWWNVGCWPVLLGSRRSCHTAKVNAVTPDSYFVVRLSKFISAEHCSADSPAGSTSCRHLTVHGVGVTSMLGAGLCMWTADGHATWQRCYLAKVQSVIPYSSVVMLSRLISAAHCSADFLAGCTCCQNLTVHGMGVASMGIVQLTAAAYACAV